MANKKRGYYTLKLGGKMRTMHFSMNFWSNFTEFLQVPLDKIGDVFSQGVSIKAIIGLVYSGLLAHDQEQSNEIDYNEFKVGMWLEDFDAEKLNDLLSNRISFPINLLPECEWLTIIRNQNLEAADINKLIKLIPKNTTSEIKQIKRFLQILRTPKLI